MRQYLTDSNPMPKIEQKQTQVPNLKKQDLLEPFSGYFAQNHNSHHTQQTSISISPSPEPNPNSSERLNDRRIVKHGKELDEILDQHQNHIIMEAKELEKLTPKNLKPFENLEKLEHPRKQVIERQRKSSFFESEEFSCQLYNLETMELQIPYTRDRLSETNDILIDRRVTASPEQLRIDGNQSEKYFSRDSSDDIMKMIDQHPQDFQPQKEISFIPTKDSQKKILQKLKNSLKNVKKEDKLQEINQKGQKKQKKQSLEFQNVKLNKNVPICFHCGGSHYYNQCTLNVDIAKSSEVKCFNCKKQGHTSRYCPQQRKCSYCTSTDHLARDCPSLEANKQQKVCLNCQNMGHFAKQCPVPKKCFLCHQVGHEIRYCPKNRQNRQRKQNLEIVNREKVCYNCRKPGHYANECKQPQKCHHCSQQGHYSRDCPHLLRSLSTTHQNKPNNIEQKQKAESLQKPQSQTVLESASKKKIFGNFHFKKYLKPSNKQNSSKSKISMLSKSERSKRMSKKLKQKHSKLN